MAAQYCIYGTVVFACFYSLMRWAVTPALVHRYPSLCHRSVRAGSSSQSDSPEERARLRNHACSVLSERATGLVMSVQTSLVGAYVFKETVHDCVWARCSILVPFSRFAIGYFFVDFFSMFQDVIWKYELTLSVSTLVLFLKRRFLMILHHITIIFLCYIVTDYDIRSGRGDFFIGLFCVMEFSTPFMSVYFIQRQMGAKDTLCYYINGIVFVSTFFIFRILLFPFMYVIYAQQYHNGGLLAAVSSMNWRCHMTIFGVFSFMLYWFTVMMCRIAHTAIQFCSKSKKL